MSRNKYFLLTTRNSLIASLIVLIPFVVLFVFGLTANEWLNELDRNIGYIFHAMRTFERTQIAVGITTTGDVFGQTAITLFTMLILISLRQWKAGLWFGLTVLIGAGFLNSYVKDLFQRVRPDYVEHLIVQDGYAFPSGHSMGSMIIFGGIFFLVARYFVREKALKWIVGILAALTIILIGFSRIYLGVHYPSDVLGGYSLGAAWLLFSIGTIGLRAVK